MNRRALGGRLKALRQQKEWSQEELARRLRVSRNTVNRWEMGQRAPSLKMIERVTAELGVGVDAVLPDVRLDQGRGPLPVPGYLVTFDLRVLKGKPFTGPLLSLMAIVNDLTSVQKQLIITGERLRGATEAERSILVGESNYLFRRMCALLHEAEDMFDRLENRADGVLDAAVRDHVDGQEALQRIRSAYQAERTAKKAKKKSFLHAVRDWVASHYDPQQLESQLVKGINARRLEGTVTLTPYAGIGRYTFLDEIATHVMRQALRASEQDFQRRFDQQFGEVMQLVEALATLVGYLVGHLLEPHAEEIKQEESVIRVDPLIARARYETEIHRRSRKAG